MPFELRKGKRGGRKQWWVRCLNAKCKEEYGPATYPLLDRLRQFIEDHRLTTDPPYWELLLQLFPWKHKMIERRWNNEAKAALLKAAGQDGFQGDGWRN